MASVQEIEDGVQKALLANKDHHYALKVYSEKLEAEIETLDKLLAVADVSDNEDELDIDAGGIVVIPGSIKTLDLIPSSDLIAEDSPFHEEASRRERYLELTTIHQWKNSELDALADAVRSENYRIHALEAQTRGQQAFSRPGDVPAGFLEHNMTGIDWERVASKVSAARSPSVQRTAKECEIRWLGDRHPRFNHSPWAQSEIVRVRELVAGAIEGQVDWTDIAAKLGTRRTPVDCMRHTVIRRTHVWTPESDERLLHAIDMYGIDNWNLVARYVSEDATPAQCQSRFTRSLDPDIKRGPWTEEEDAMLQRCITVFGHSWIDVASFIPGRSNEQCRERYQEGIGPTGGKGKWTPEEDEALLRAAEQVKNLSWKAISRLLGNGRTDNMCRSRYAILTKRKQRDGTATPKTAEASACATRSGSPASSVFTERSLSVQTPRSFQHVEVTPSSEFLPSNTATESNVPTPTPRPQPRHRQNGVAGSTSVDANLVTPAEVPAASPTTLQADAQPAMDTKPSEEKSADEPATATVSKGRASKTTKRQLLDEIADRATRKRRKKSMKDAEVVTTNSQTSVVLNAAESGSASQPATAAEEGYDASQDQREPEGRTRQEAKLPADSSKGRLSAIAEEPVEVAGGSSSMLIASGGLAEPVASLLPPGTTSTDNSAGRRPTRKRTTSAKTQPKTDDSNRAARSRTRVSRTKKPAVASTVTTADRRVTRSMRPARLASTIVAGSVDASLAASQSAEDSSELSSPPSSP